MCLSKICQITKKGGTGYKVFAKNVDGSFRSLYAFLFTHNYAPDSMKIGEIIKDKNENFLWIDVKTGYQLGFHIFASLKAAKRWMNYRPILKVKFWDVVAEGYQEIKNKSYKVYVARKIQLLEEVK